MSKVADITPTHKPLALLRYAEEVVQGEGPEMVSATVIMMDEEGELWYETCGMSNRDVLWALQISMARLIRKSVMREDA